MSLVYHKHNQSRTKWYSSGMGILRQQETRTELQQKLAAELQERAKQKAKTFDQPDGVTDSAYIKGTKQTSNFAWVWMLVCLAIVGVVVWLIVSTL